MQNPRAPLPCFCSKPRCAAALFVSLPFLLASPAAQADETAAVQAQPALEGKEREEALATELFNAARELMSQERYGDACPKLIESAKLLPKVGTFGKLAECEEKLGQLVSARARWLMAKHLAEAQNDERLTIVQSELARVDALVPKLSLTLSKPLPAGFLIRIDGVEIGSAAADIPIPLDPGKHAVVISAPDKKPWTADISLKADGSLTVLSVPVLESAQAGTASPAPAAMVNAPSSPWRYVGFGAAGLGGAGIALGAFFGGRAISKLDESNRLGCANNQCSPVAAEIRDEARSAGNASTAFFIAGGLLFAGGLTLAAFAPSTTKAAITEQKISQTKIVAGLTGISIQGNWQ